MGFGSARRRHLQDVERGARHRHLLARPRRAVVEPEGDVEQQQVEPEEAEDGPGAERHEERADAEPHRGDDAHQHEEAPPPQRAVRRQQGAEDRFVCGFRLGHDTEYRRSMTKPKSNSATSAKKPRLRTGSQVKPRPRPQRPPMTAYSQAEIGEIFRRFSVQRPEPKGELEHVNAFTLLVAVVLSAQATDAGVNKATRALFGIADTPEKRLALGEERVGEHIRTIGLWRNKAKNVIALSQALISDFGGAVPGKRDELMTLPGVGR